jgi:uncharacterized Ntn-hydrolase superfamily protein
MTFSLIGRCEATGQLGAVTTTSDLAVGARVPFARAGVGVAVTQSRTDPRLGPALLEALADGLSAAEAVARVAEAHADRAWRQLGALDPSGVGAAHTGERAWPIAGARSGPGCLALGNMLRGENVLSEIVTGFTKAPGLLAERLLSGIAAGQRAGGETGALRSAALLVVERESFPLVDLRIDDAADPLDALLALWERYRPWVREFTLRALDPDAAQGVSSTTT